MTRETRHQTIERHVRAATRGTGLPLRTYADRVVECYHARTALHDRTVPFQIGATADTYEAAARANAQTVERLLNGTVRAPIDLEESLVLALPSEHREACLRDLADRYGLLAAPQPVADGVEQQTTTATLMRETGELLAALAPAFADGKLDHSDIASARRALPELLDLQAQLATLSVQLERIACPARTTTTPLSLRVAR